MGLLNLTKGVGLVLLFSIACFTFLIGMVERNNPTNTLTATNPQINSTLNDLQDRSDELNALADSSKDLIENAQPSPVYLFLILYSAFAIPLGFLAFLIKGVGSVFSLLFVSIFGQGASPFYIVTSIVSAGVLLTIIILILREIRIGKS